MMYLTRDTSSVCTQYFLVERTKSCKMYSFYILRNLHLVDVCMICSASILQRDGVCFVMLCSYAIMMWRDVSNCLRQFWYSIHVSNTHTHAHIELSQRCCTTRTNSHTHKYYSHLLLIIIGYNSFITSDDFVHPTHCHHYI